ncbi:MAG: carboxypeptidase-like regulatory domain-containing protein [Planctomycetaceae bacterium]|nr:carboxypeptidase-like regulatory domain-containing protein [Planctomycetaceae bacterium]
MRKFRHLLMLLSLLLLLLFPIIGCSKAPPELGTLYPATITVTDKGTPLEGVLVSLVNKEIQTPRGCSALTNSAGVAKITTNIGSYTGKGVVAGNYRVTLFKMVTFPPELQGGEEELTLPENERKEREKKRSEFIENNRIIPPLLESRTSSPIELTVEKKSTVLTIDLSQY